MPPARMLSLKPHMRAWPACTSNMFYRAFTPAANLHMVTTWAKATRRPGSVSNILIAANPGTASTGPSSGGPCWRRSSLSSLDVGLGRGLATMTNNDPLPIILLIELQQQLQPLSQRQLRHVGISTESVPKKYCKRALKSLLSPLFKARIAVQQILFKITQ